MFHAFSRLSIQLRWLLFVLSLLLVAFATTGFKVFKLDASVRSYFSDDYRHYLEFKAMESVFGRENSAIIMVSPRDGAIFTPTLLSSFSLFTNEAWQLDHIKRVDSIANYQHTFVDDDELIVEDLIPFDEDITDARAAEIKAIARQEISLHNKLISSDGEHLGLIVNFNINEDDNDQIERIARNLYTFAEKFTTDYNAKVGEDHAIETAIAGGFISTYHNIDIAKYDFGVMVPLMFFLMFVMLGLIMKTISGTSIALIIAALSTIGAYGLGAYAGITFSIISFNGVIIIITITVAHCIHILQHFLQHYDGTNKRQALLDSLSINALPVSLTSFTTLLGFLSLNLSELPPVVSLGNVSAIGVVLCWIFAFTVLPALTLCLPFKVKRHRSTPRLTLAMASLANYVIKHKAAVLVTTLILSAIMITLSVQNILNDRFSELIKKPHIFRTDNETIDRYFGAMYDINLSMDSGRANGITDLDYLNSIDQLTTWLRQQPEVKSVNAMTDILKRLNQNLHEGNPDYYRLPESKELAAQYLLMYEMSLPFGLDLTNQIGLERRKSRIQITFAAMDTHQTFEIANRIMAWQEQHIEPGYRSTPTSVSYMWGHLGVDSLKESLKSSLLALLLISAIMIIALRSFKYGLISLVPNIFPAIFGFGIWYLIKGEIDMGLTSVMIITIGIVVDDTVHFLSKYKHAREVLKNSVEDAVRYAFTTVGSAISITTLVLVTGFSLLLLSQSASNSHLGLLTAIILFSALLMDFFLLPALLLFLDKDKKQTRKAVSNT